jgi:hypothetical protein
MGACAARLARTSWPGRQRLLPVHGPAIGFAAAMAARSVALQWISVEDPFNAALFTIFAVGSTAVELLAIGVYPGLSGPGPSAARSPGPRPAWARHPRRVPAARAGGAADRGLRIAYWLPGR